MNIRQNNIVQDIGYKIIFTQVDRETRKYVSYKLIVFLYHNAVAIIDIRIMLNFPIIAGLISSNTLYSIKQGLNKKEPKILLEYHFYRFLYNKMGDHTHKYIYMYMYFVQCTWANTGFCSGGGRTEDRFRTTSIFFILSLKFGIFRRI